MMEILCLICENETMRPSESMLRREMEDKEE
jgi:hypothetical protein